MWPLKSGNELRSKRSSQCCSTWDSRKRAGSLVSKLKVAYDRPFTEENLGKTMEIKGKPSKKRRTPCENTFL